MSRPKDPDTQYRMKLFSEIRTCHFLIYLPASECLEKCVDAALSSVCDGDGDYLASGIM